MTLVIVERRLDGVAFEELGALEAAVSSCLELHGVTPLHSYISRDGRHAVCFYEAPDAEAVRITQRTGSLPYDHIWSARAFPVNEDAPEAFETVIAQRALPRPHPPGYLEHLLREPDGCSQIHRAYLQETFLSRNGERMLCRFYAPDAEAVRNISRDRLLPLERAWTARRIG